MQHANIVIIEPTNAERAGVGQTDAPAGTVDGGGCGATVGLDVGERHRFTAALGGHGFYGCHATRSARMSAGRQGRCRLIPFVLACGVPEAERFEPHNRLGEVDVPRHPAHRLRAR